MKTSRQMREFESEEVATIGRFKIVLLGADEQNSGDEDETWLCTYNDGTLAGSIPFKTREEAEHYARKRSGMPMDTKAPAKPLWQLDIRQRLALSPDRTDPISRLLFAALYAAEDEAEFLNMVENHVEELRRAIDATKAGAK